MLKQRCLGHETHRPVSGDADDYRINQRVTVIRTQQNRTDLRNTISVRHLDTWVIK
jgi:hypothetical protein